MTLVGSEWWPKEFKWFTLQSATPKDHTMLNTIPKLSYTKQATSTQFTLIWNPKRWHCSIWQIISKGLGWHTRCLYFNNHIDANNLVAQCHDPIFWMEKLGLKSSPPLVKGERTRIWHKAALKIFRFESSQY